MVFQDRQIESVCQCHLRWACDHCDITNCCAGLAFDVWQLNLELSCLLLVLDYLHDQVLTAFPTLIPIYLTVLPTKGPWPDFPASLSPWPVARVVPLACLCVLFDSINILFLIPFPACQR